MVMSEVASKKFNWKPRIMEEDDVRIFTPDYVVAEEAEVTVASLKSSFADLPSSGIWEDRIESDDELLEELGSGWRGFATEQ